MSKWLVELGYLECSIKIMLGCFLSLAAYKQGHYYNTMGGIQVFLGHLIDLQASDLLLGP